MIPEEWVSCLSLVPNAQGVVVDVFLQAPLVFSFLNLCSSGRAFTSADVWGPKRRCSLVSKVTWCSIIDYGGKLSIHHRTQLQLVTRSQIFECAGYGPERHNRCKIIMASHVATGEGREQRGFFDEALPKYRGCCPFCSQYGNCPWAHGQKALVAGTQCFDYSFGGGALRLAFLKILMTLHKSD